MNFYINQSIQINFIKIGGVTNSSVFQIGSAGMIKPASSLYNTGGYTEPAPQPQQTGVSVFGAEQFLQDPAVPLQSIDR